jgi:hypothetical protein
MPFRLLLCGAIAVALAACSDQSQTPSDPSNPSDPPPIASQQLTSLTLRPASIWLVQADTFAAFIPVGRTVAGDTVRPSVTWQAGGGQMTADGRYIAGLDTGTYTVTATAGGRQAHSTVFLAFHIVEIIITPSKVTLAPGGKQQFKARGRTITGDTVAVKVIWKATGGTITQSGLFTAGSKGGTISVIATLAPPEVNGQPVVFPRRTLLPQANVRIDQAP